MCNAMNNFKKQLYPFSDADRKKTRPSAEGRQYLKESPASAVNGYKQLVKKGISKN